jgi:hypothetical protein
MRPAIIAIDFDGTIVEHIYPLIGQPVPGALEVMKELQAKGHRLMLWTMRSGEPLAHAVKYCEDNGIKFWGVNENPEQQTPPMWSTSNKQYAQIYIDDAALGCPLQVGVQGTRPMVCWKSVRAYCVTVGLL